MERSRLQADLLTWMTAWHREAPDAVDPDGARFAGLALRVFAWQFAQIEAYASFCRSRGATPETVRAPEDIPLVPVSAFKIAPLCTAAALARPACVFETSGTSDGRPGRVHLFDTALYDAALHATFARFVVPGEHGRRFRCVSLVPGATARPHSSLGYMVRRLAQRWDDGFGSQHLGQVADGEALDVAGLHAALQRACAEGVPVLLFATTLALGLWLEQAPDGPALRLPAGSRLMDTGGPKGRRLALSRAEQHARLAARLGLDPSALVGELGMTELCSQRYETTTRAAVCHDLPPLRAYAGPPWLRARVLHPADRRPCAPGDTGMVGHIDLANLDTCAFVLTADLGHTVPLPDGSAALVLGGRIPGAEWRGCGLDAEDLVLGPDPRPDHPHP